jgi:flagellar biogenesis protein FliO
LIFILFVVYLAWALRRCANGEKRYR